MKHACDCHVIVSVTWQPWNCYGREIPYAPVSLSDAYSSPSLRYFRCRRHHQWSCPLFPSIPSRIISTHTISWINPFLFNRGRKKKQNYITLAYEIIIWNKFRNVNTMQDATICPHVGRGGRKMRKAKAVFGYTEQRRYLGGAKILSKSALSVRMSICQHPPLPWMNGNGGTEGCSGAEGTESRSLCTAHALNRSLTSPGHSAASLQKDSQGFWNWNVWMFCWYHSIICFTVFRVIEYCNFVHGSPKFVWVNKLFFASVSVVCWHLWS